MNFHSIVYTIYVQVMSILQTHMLSVSYGDEKSLGLRGEGRRDWEGME